MGEENVTCGLVVEKLPTVAGAFVAVEEALQENDMDAVIVALEALANLANSAVEGLLLTGLELPADEPLN